MALLMVLYSITRMPIEALRADERPLLAGMNSAQLISIALVIMGAAAWLSLRFSISLLPSRDAPYAYDGQRVIISVVELRRG